MGFYAKFTLASCDGWPNADIQSNSICLLFYRYPRHINPIGWKHEARGVQISGRKADLLANFVAGDNRAGNGISPSEHLAGGIDIACADQRPDPRAVDHLPVQGNSGKAMNLEIQFSTQFF